MSIGDGFQQRKQTFLYILTKKVGAICIWSTRIPVHESYPKGRWEMGTHCETETHNQLTDRCKNGPRTMLQELARRICPQLCPAGTAPY